METNNYIELMNSKELEPITPEYSNKIKFGTLIGFKTYDKLTAAYPVWSHIGNEIQFILFTKENGKHCIDNTWITSDSLYINKEPIIVPLSVNQSPTTFGNEVVNFFNK